MYMQGHIVQLTMFLSEAAYNHSLYSEIEKRFNIAMPDLIKLSVTLREL